LFLYENHIGASSLCIFYKWWQLCCVSHDYYYYLFIYPLFCILCCFSCIMRDYHMLMDIEDNFTIVIRFCFIDLVIANNVFSNWYAPFFRFSAKFDQCKQHLGCHYISVYIIIPLFATWGVACKPQSLGEV